MPNQSPEQDLIDSFLARLDQDGIDIELHNDRCRAQQFADIEFTLASGRRWAIEAKSHGTSDDSNAVHKVFGELLKETGRSNRDNCNVGILLDEGGITFYNGAFRKIPRCKFLGFGLLVPVRCVFSFGASGVRHTSWEQFYDRSFHGCSLGFPTG